MGKNEAELDETSIDSAEADEVTKGKKPAKVKLKAEPKAAPVGRGSKLIMIPAIKAVQTEVTIKGISPLIVHAWSEKAKKIMRDKHMGHAPDGKEPRDPDAEFNACRYINAEGQDCIPAVALKSCAVEAGVICGVFKTTLRKSFFVVGELIPIISDPPTIREDMVRIGQGTADLRWRAEYKDWSIKIPVEFQPRMISAEQLFNLFDNAGYSVGVGEWRPEKDGQYGRFRVEVAG